MGNEVHAVIGEPGPEGHGANSLAPAFLGIQCALDPEAVFGAFACKPSHNTISGIESKARERDDGHTKLQDELRNASSRGSQVPHLKDNDEIDIPSTSASDQPTSFRSAPSVVGQLLIDRARDAQRTLELDKLRTHRVCLRPVARKKEVRSHARARGCCGDV
jgi:hypothetical protein